MLMSNIYVSKQNKVFPKKYTPNISDVVISNLICGTQISWGIRDFTQ